MAMLMNLGNVVAETTSKPHLKAWTIQDVVFKGVEYNEFKGKDQATYRTLNAKFENENGEFTLSLYMPKEGDDVREDQNGKPRPSTFDNFCFAIAHMGKMLSPDLYAKLENASFDVTTPDGFKKFVELYAKALTPGVGKTIGLKLIGDKKGYARIPFCLGMKDGNTFVASNFLGDKLFFSTFEEQQKTKLAEAKPTSPEDEFSAATASKVVNTAASASDDLPF